MRTEPSPLAKASSSPSGENPRPIIVYEIAEYTRSSDVFFPPSPGFQRWCSRQSAVSRNSTALELRRIASSCPFGEKQGGLSSLASVCTLVSSVKSRVFQTLKEFVAMMAARSSPLGEKKASLAGSSATSLRDTKSTMRNRLPSDRPVKRPSGEKRNPRVEESRLRLVSACLAPTSQSLTVRSRLPETRVWLSGVKSSDQIRPLCPRNITGGLLRSCASQSFTVWSRLLDASQRPSRENTTQSTGALCQPTKYSWPSPTFHSRTVWSIEAVANRLPSGEKQTQETMSRCGPKVFSLSR